MSLSVLSKEVLKHQHVTLARKSHQCQVDRRHKEWLWIQMLKAGEKEQAVLAGGDKTKDSIIPETQQGEPRHRKSQCLGLSPSKIQELIQRSLQWQGVTLEGRRYFQAIKKAEEDQRAAQEVAGNNLRAKYFLWSIPGQDDCQVYSPAVAGRYHSSTEHGVKTQGTLSYTVQDVSLLDSD